MPSSICQRVHKNVLFAYCVYLKKVERVHENMLVLGVLEKEDAVTPYPLLSRKIFKQLVCKGRQEGLISLMW